MSRLEVAGPLGFLAPKTPEKNAQYKGCDEGDGDGRGEVTAGKIPGGEGDVEIGQHGGAGGRGGYRLCGFGWRWRCGQRQSDSFSNGAR